MPFQASSSNARRWIRDKSAIASQLQAAIRPGPDGDGNLLPVLDQFQPEGSTATVAFSTAKPVEPTTRSHVNYVVCDSELERQIAHELESDDRVESYVKNDHLFCEIPYRHEGRTLRYIPDFLVRLPDGRRLLVEGKGRERLKDQAKQTAASRWVAAVNADGRWGIWSHAVVRHRSEVPSVISESLSAQAAGVGT